MLPVYIIICFFFALFVREKNNIEHTFFAWLACFAVTPLFGKKLYRYIMDREVKKIREGKKRRNSDAEAIRRERLLKEWYINRIPDDEIDRINSLPTFEERLKAAQSAVDRIIEDDRHNPAAPEPPVRSFY
jgi:hypothetical protein